MRLLKNTDGLLSGLGNALLSFPQSQHHLRGTANKMEVSVQRGRKSTRVWRRAMRACSSGEREHVACARRPSSALRGLEASRRARSALRQPGSQALPRVLRRRRRSRRRSSRRWRLQWRLPPTLTHGIDIRQDQFDVSVRTTRCREAGRRAPCCASDTCSFNTPVIGSVSYLPKMAMVPWDGCGCVRAMRTRATCSGGSRASWWRHSNSPTRRKNSNPSPA